MGKLLYQINILNVKYLLKILIFNTAPIMLHNLQNHRNCQFLDKITLVILTVTLTTMIKISSHTGLYCFLVLKTGICLRDSKQVLINPSRLEGPQTEADASVTSFTHLSVA